MSKCKFILLDFLNVELEIDYYLTWTLKIPIWLGEKVQLYYIFLFKNFVNYVKNVPFGAPNSPSRQQWKRIETTIQRKFKLRKIRFFQLLE